MCKEFDFADQKFYGDGWISQLQLHLTRPENLELLHKLKVVDHQGTYEPKQICFEQSQVLEGWREKDTDELLKEREFEYFKSKFFFPEEKEDDSQAEQQEE